MCSTAWCSAGPHSATIVSTTQPRARRGRWAARGAKLGWAPWPGHARSLGSAVDNIRWQWRRDASIGRGKALIGRSGDVWT